MSLVWQSAFSSAPPSAGRSRGPALPWHGGDALFVYRPRPRPEPNISPHKKIDGALRPAVRVSKRLAEFASADAKSYNHFLSRPVRERKYLSGCQCGICPSQTDKLCAQQTASLLSEKPGGFFDSPRTAEPLLRRPLCSRIICPVCSSPRCRQSWPWSSPGSPP